MPIIIIAGTEQFYTRIFMEKEIENTQDADINALNEKIDKLLKRIERLEMNIFYIVSDIVVLKRHIEDKK